MQTQFLFIFNQEAGHSSQEKIITEINRMAKKCRIPETLIHIIFSTTIVVTEQLIMKYEAQAEQLVVIACGGDGTVNRIANLILDKPIIFSMLPLGTGNDLYHSLYQKRSLRTHLKAIFEQKTVATDAIYVEELANYVLNEVNVGLDAEVVAAAEKIRDKVPFLRKFSYLLGIPSTLQKGVSRAFSFEAKRHGTRIPIAKGPYAIAVTANGGYYGSGFHVNPLFDVSDGQLELIYIPKVSALRAPEILYKLLTGRMQSTPAIHIEKVDWIKYVATTQPLLFSLDGELYEKDTLTFRVIANKYLRIK